MPDAVTSANARPNDATPNVAFGDSRPFFPSLGRAFQLCII